MPSIYLRHNSKRTRIADTALRHLLYLSTSFIPHKLEESFTSISPQTFKACHYNTDWMSAAYRVAGVAQNI
jgi:hypothetical protein